MKIFVAAFLLASVLLVILLSHSMDDITLSAEEEQQALAACIRCHGADPHEDDDEDFSRYEDRSDCIRCHDDVHNIHSSADCMRCHPGADGLESADNAHDTLRWVGLGVMAAVAAGLGVNFTVVRARRQSDGGSNGR